MRRLRARVSEEKVRRLEEHIAARPTWPDVDLAWAAGCFEGEGTIAIVRSGGRSRSVVSLTNTDREIVDFFQARWPGIVQRVAPKKPQHREAFEWRLQGNQCIAFLLDMGPQLRTTAERAKAALLIESQRARWAGYRLAGHNELMESFRLRMSAMNKRGSR